MVVRSLHSLEVLGSNPLSEWRNLGSPLCAPSVHPGVEWVPGVSWGCVLSFVLKKAIGKDSSTGLCSVMEQSQSQVSFHGCRSPGKRMRHVEMKVASRMYSRGVWRSGWEGVKKELSMMQRMNSMVVAPANVWLVKGWINNVLRGCCRSCSVM